MVKLTKLLVRNTLVFDVGLGSLSAKQVHNGYARLPFVKNTLSAGTLGQSQPGLTFNVKLGADDCRDLTRKNVRLFSLWQKKSDMRGSRLISACPKEHAVY